MTRPGSSIDITDRIPSICLACPQRDFVIDYQTIFYNDVPLTRAFISCDNARLCLTLAMYLKEVTNK